jgi:hypothetical protein
MVLSEVLYGIKLKSVLGLTDIAVSSIIFNLRAFSKNHIFNTQSPLKRDSARTSALKKSLALAKASAKAGFHMNSFVNGANLTKYLKSTGSGIHGNHPAYTNWVLAELNHFAGNSSDPIACKKFLEEKLIPKLKGIISIVENSPTGNLNQYFINSAPNCCIP